MYYTRRTRLLQLHTNITNMLPLLLCTACKCVTVARKQVNELATDGRGFTKPTTRLHQLVKLKSMLAFMSKEMSDSSKYMYHMPLFFAQFHVVCHTPNTTKCWFCFISFSFCSHQLRQTVEAKRMTSCHLQQDKLPSAHTVNQPPLWCGLISSSTVIPTDK